MSFLSRFLAGARMRHRQRRLRLHLRSMLRRQALLMEAPLCLLLFSSAAACAATAACTAAAAKSPACILVV